MTASSDYLDGYRAGYADGFADASRIAQNGSLGPSSPPPAPSPPETPREAPAPTQEIRKRVLEKSLDLPDEGLANSKQVAHHFAVSTGTLANWRKAKIGPTWIKSGPNYLYPVTEVRHTMREVQRTHAIPPIPPSKLPPE